jgi:hypothetical protein
MKNIHILPTLQPSRLWFHKLNRNLGFSDLPMEYNGSGTWVEGRNIYITNDEEIKEGEYQLFNPLGNFNNAKVSKAERLLESDGRRKKIILTTDKDLIKDGVQAIDDEFIEWFVKNPSCDEIYVNKIESFDFGIDKYVYNYKIIIPKEQPKQDWYCPKCQSYVSSESVTFEETHQICNTSVVIEEPKQDCECTDECLGYLTKDCKRIEQPKQETPEIITTTKFSWEQEQDNTANEILNYILTNDDGVGIALGYNSREMIEQHFKNINYDR